MPEGHSVHRIARQFERNFVGHRIAVSSPQGRFADGAAVLNGTELIEVWAVGKQMFMEFDNERAGGFEPLRKLPKGKKVALGLVTTKVGELESVDTLVRRIDEAAKVVPLDQLCLSLIDGRHSLGEIADILLQRFPQCFSDRTAALNHIAGLAGRY